MHTNIAAYISHDDRIIIIIIESQYDRGHIWEISVELQWAQWHPSQFQNILNI